MKKELCECFFPRINLENIQFCKICGKLLEEWSDPVKEKRGRGRPVGTKQTKTHLLDRYAKEALRVPIRISAKKKRTIFKKETYKVRACPLPGPKPVIDSGPGERMFDCPAVDFCVKTADKRNYEKFNCEKCPRYEPERGADVGNIYKK